MKLWEELEQQPEYGLLTPEDKVAVHDEWRSSILGSLVDEDPEAVDAAGVNRFVATERARNQALKTGKPFDPATAEKEYFREVGERTAAQKQALADYDELEREKFALRDAESVKNSAVYQDTFVGEGAKILNETIANKKQGVARIESRFTPEMLQQVREVREAEKGERPTAMLGSDLYTDPSLLLDKDKYRAAVAESGASPEAKARAMAEFASKRKQFAEEALRTLRIAGESPIPGAQDFPSWESSQPEDVRRLSPEDKALQYMREMQKRGDIRKLTSAIGTGLLQGGTDIASQGLGVAAMVANSGELAEKAAEVAKGAQTLEEVSKLEGDKQATGATTLGGAARLLPPMAATIAPAALTGGANLGVSAALAGAQTAGAQFPTTYTELRKQGMSEQDALNAARNSAIVSGIITAGLTTAFGRTGMEAALGAGAGGKELVKSRLVAAMKGVPKGAVAEIPEELLDEMATQVIEQRTIDPTKPVSQIVDEFAETAPDLAMQIALLGGVGGGIGRYRGSTTEPKGESEAAPADDFTRRAALEGATEYRAPEVKVNGVTIATIPEGSDMTPEDVLDFANSPEDMAMLARNGKIVLPEVVAPIEGVDPAITDEMNAQFAKGKAEGLANETLVELERQKVEDEASAFDEVLRAQEKASRDEEVRLDQMKAQEEAAIAKEAEARRQAAEALKAAPEVDIPTGTESLGVTPPPAPTLEAPEGAARNADMLPQSLRLRRAAGTEQGPPIGFIQSPSTAVTNEQVVSRLSPMQWQSLPRQRTGDNGRFVALPNGGGVKTGGADRPTSENFHKAVIRDSLRLSEPVSAEAIDTYGIALPEGYVLQDDLYVFQPAVTEDTVSISDIPSTPETPVTSQGEEPTTATEGQPMPGGGIPPSRPTPGMSREEFNRGMAARVKQATATEGVLPAAEQAEWSPTVGQPATATINGQKIVGTVGPSTGKGLVSFQYERNGKTQKATVRPDRLESPVASLTDPPKYQYTQEQNTRKMGKHFPVALGVHANHDFRKPLASMAEDTSLSETYRQIAKVLSTMPAFANVDLHIVADGRKNYAGEYSFFDGKASILVNLRQVGRGKVDALGTILHEALHHVTLAKVLNPQGAFEIEVVGKLDKIRERVAEYAKQQGISQEAIGYEIDTLEEFISALTRPDFQRFLASIPDSFAPGVAVGKYRSVLSEVFRHIAELLFKKPVPKGSTLEQYTTTILALFETPHRTIPLKPLSYLRAQSKPGYRTPADMLAEAAEKVKGERAAEKPQGLASMFKPQAKRPATGERKLLDMPVRNNLADAYREAVRGSSTQMAPLSSVYAQARLLQPGLTPEAFLAQVQEGYDNGTLLLEGAGSQQEAEQAGLALPGTPVGTAVRMMPAPETPKSLVDEETDAAYMAAVEAGDMEKAQKMVDEAAKAAMPDSVAHERMFSSKERRQDKPLLKVYHGTDQEFNIFESGRPTADDWGFFGAIETNRHGIFFAENKTFAETYAKARQGKRVITAFLNIKNPFQFTDAQDILESRDLGEEMTADFHMARWLMSLRHQWEAFDGREGVDFTNWLREKGYDGALIQEDGHGLVDAEETQDVWVALDPSQIKSADPVTRDEAGNVIPLSQRFNPESNSILYAAPINTTQSDESSAANTGTGASDAQRGGDIPSPLRGTGTADTEAGGGTNPVSVLAKLKAGREAAISSAVAESDWGNYTPEQKTEALNSFIRSTYGAASLHNWSKLRGVSGPVFIRGTEGFASVEGNVSANEGLRIALTYDHRNGFDPGVKGNASARDMFTFAYDVAQEEIIHAADKIGAFQRWEASGRPGTFGAFERGESLQAVDQLNKARADLQQTDPAAAQKIKDAMLASWGVYHGSPIADISGLVRHLESAKNASTYLYELRRQLTQLKRQDFTTETGWQKFRRVLEKWLTDAINSLRGVQDVFRSGMAGDLIQRQLADLEAALEGKPLPSVSRGPVASLADEGGEPPIIDIGGEAEPADGPAFAFTRARFAPPKPEDQMYQVQSDEEATKKAFAWINAVGPFRAADLLMADRAPSDMDLNVKNIVMGGLLKGFTEISTDPNASEDEKTVARATNQRLGKYRVRMNQDAARGMRQIGVQNGAVLQPIAPILAAEEVLADRGEKILKGQFEGGSEGAAPQVAAAADSATAEADERLENIIRRLMGSLRPKQTAIGALARMFRGKGQRDQIIGEVAKALMLKARGNVVAPERKTALANLVSSLKSTLAASVKGEKKPAPERTLQDLLTSAFVNQVSEGPAFEAAWKEGRQKVLDMLIDMELDKTFHPAQKRLADLRAKLTYLEAGSAEQQEGSATEREQLADQIKEAKAEAKAAMDAVKVMTPQLEAQRDALMPAAPTVAFDPVSSREAIGRAFEKAGYSADLATGLDKSGKRALSTKDALLNRQRAVDAVMKVFDAEMQAPDATTQNDWPQARALALRAVNETLDSWQAQADADKVAKLEATKKSFLGEDSKALEKLVNSIRDKILPDSDWSDILYDLPRTQAERLAAIKDRVAKHEALQNLTPDESEKLADNIDKLWQRERLKAFQDELFKAGVLKARTTKAIANVASAAPELLRLMNLGVFNSSTFREAVAKKFGLKLMSNEQAGFLRKLAVEAWEQPQGVLRNKKLKQLVEGLQHVTGSNWADAMNSYWTASVLSGLRTHFDTWGAVVNGLGTNLIQAGLQLSKGKGVAAFDIQAQWWKGLFTGLNEALYLLRTGDPSFTKRFEADLIDALDGEKTAHPIAIGEKMWKSGSLLQKIPGALMMVVGRSMVAADHINNTATTQGAMAVARAMNPELYEGKTSWTQKEIADARKQAIAETTGGVEPESREEVLTVNKRTREILNAGLTEADQLAASEVGDIAAFQNDPTGLFGGLYHAVKSGLSSAVRSRDQVAQDEEAAKITRAFAAVTAGSVHALTGTRFMRFGFNLGNEFMRYMPGSWLLNKGTNILGRKLSPMQQEMLIGKNVVGGILLATLYSLFGDDDESEDGKWHMEGPWNDLSLDEQASRLSAGMAKNSFWRRKDGKIERISYSQWPTAGLLAAVGSMLDEKRYKPEDWNQRGVAGHILQGAVTGLFQVQNAVAMQQVAELFSTSSSYGAAQGMPEKVIKMGTNYLGGLMPTVVKDLDKWQDPRNFRADGAWEKLVREMPVARRFVNDGRPQFNRIGQEVRLHREPYSRLYTADEADKATVAYGQLLARGIDFPTPSTSRRIVKDGKKVPMDTLGKAVTYEFEKAVALSYGKFLQENGERIATMSTKALDKLIRDRATRILDIETRKVQAKVNNP